MEKGISLSLKKFIAHFCEGIRQEKRFCFILGAGASKSSGIPTGAELAKKWIAELEEQDNDDLEEWLKENQIDKNDYATHYSDIFAKRFELSPKNGFAFLESVISDAEPSCGYSFLAQILAKDKHNIVITTNFDSLTEDALFIYTQKKPLVIGHSALADYITATPSRPLVIKIHHDLFLSPKNTTEETSELDEKITNGLKEIFKRYTPLVIGYGGNDGSLMNFLKKLGHFEEGIFWFYIHEEDIKPEVKELVKHAKGHFVRINGFDHLMVQLGNQLGLEQLDGMIESIAKNRAKRYRKQVEDLNKLETTDTETKKAMGEITSRGQKSWWSYVLAADAEKDVKKADTLYREGIKEFPNSSEILGEYAVFLKNIMKDYIGAEKYYQKSLELNPDDANVNGNYAVFLNAIRKDYVEAEKYYQKSLELNPDAANVNGNYAIFLKDIKQDYVESEKYYLKSLELDSVDANYNSNYAEFLLVCNRKKEALNFINKAFSYLNEEDDSVALVLWFYCFAAFPKKFPESRQKIEELLNRGVTSFGWDLSEIVKIAEKEKHPEIEKVKEFAKRISGEG